MNVTLWVLQVLLALVFLAHGLMMLAPPPEIAVQMDAMLPRWFQVFLGAAEVLAAVGLTLPGVTRILPGLVPAAAAGVMVVMVSATVLHLREASSARRPRRLCCWWWQPSWPTAGGGGCLSRLDGQQRRETDESVVLDSTLAADGDPRAAGVVEVVTASGSVFRCERKSRMPPPAPDTLCAVKHPPGTTFGQTATR